MENLPPGVTFDDIDVAQGDFGECSSCGEPLDSDGICRNEECDLCDRNPEDEAADDAYDSWRDQQ